MKIYVARPMSNFSLKEIQDYYDDTTQTLSDIGYSVLSPMSAQELPPGLVQPHGYANATASDHAAVRRDHWMVRRADIMFLNLLGAKNPSIGCISELSWAYDRSKHTVVIMEEGNSHVHAFILEQADVIFNSYEEGIDYLKKLSRGEK